MIHIATVHWPHPRWVDIQLRHLERNLDEPDLWVLVTHWQNVGSYRRALQGYESKVVVVPLLSEAVDEPSAYEDPALQ